MPLEPTIEEAIKAIAAGKVVDPKMLGKQAIYMAIALNYETHKMAAQQLVLMEKIEKHLENIAACTYLDPLYKTQHMRQGYSSRMQSLADTGKDKVVPARKTA